MDSHLVHIVNHSDGDVALTAAAKSAAVHSGTLSSNASSSSHTPTASLAVSSRRKLGTPMGHLHHSTGHVQSRQTIELSDGSTLHSQHEILNAFAEGTAREALRLVHVVMPQKLEAIDKLIEENKWLHIHDYDRVFERLSGEAAEGPLPDAKSCNGNVFSVAAAQAVASEAQMLEKHYQALPLLQIEIRKLSGLIKTEIVQFLDVLEKVKLYIELNIPRIEDGNNFGVSVQEDAISELSRVEESLLHISDNVLKYYASRAKLVSKIAKYPLLPDYKYAAIEIDMKQLLHLKLNFTGLRNGYAILSDMIVKNLERIMKPRSSNTGSMY